MTPERPNVVLICADQWRGDCLSIAGHPVVRTPHLDELALSGTRFARAYSGAPTCVPARVTLMTGLSAQHHGRLGYLDGVPFRHATTLAGEFGRHGYQTQAIGKMHVYPERSRIGFDNVILHDGYIGFTRRQNRPVEDYDDYLPWLRERTGDPGAEDTDTGLHCNSMEARPWNRAEELHPTNWLATTAAAWLHRRDPDVPFFLYLSFHRPHPPYDPPAWAFEEYLDTPMPPPPVGDWAEDFRDLHEAGLHTAHGAEVDERTLRRARAGYYGHMTHIDGQIHRVIQALREHRLDENTIIAFTSDHGEMAGDHQLFRKALPYEGSARVPLLLSGPDIPAGAVRDGVVELRDIMPTLLTAADLPVPDGLDGAALTTMARTGEGVRDHLHGEHVLEGESLQWLTDGRHKYVWRSRSGTEHLFDLADDPQELHNLAASANQRGDLQQWRARLVEVLTGRPEGFVESGRLVPGRPVLRVLP